LLADTLREAASRFGDRDALVAESGWSLTYRELDEVSDEVAAGLARTGVGEGDVVSLLVPASPEHFALYLAAAKLGAITAAVNPKLTAPERAAVIERAAPKLLVTTAALSPAGTGVASHEIVIAGSPETFLSNLRVAGAEPGPLRCDPDRPIAIVFTSGTTGVPKGAVFCGSQISFITECDVGANWGGGGAAVTGSALAHLGPTTKLAGSLRRGTTQYLTTAWNARDALARISELKVASVGGVPTQIALMLADPEFDRFDLSSVQAIVMGGGPATPALVREARERFGCPVAVRYSCTEAGIGTGTGFGDPLEDAEVSVGRAQPGVEVLVIGDEGAPLPEGEIGEVCLRSPAVMRGYWHTTGDENPFVAGGAVRTGDLGWLDDRGRLHLAGRNKERYVRGGYNVHPMEVEAVLADHPALEAVAVVGRPDEVMGEVGVAVIVRAPGHDAPSVAELRAFAGDRLARYKLPDEVLVIDALPLTAMDKIDRRALAQRVSDAAGAGQS
jgi:acyl-CoA synthetase (AMP-forming)/AMP-acid ligase II